MATNISSSPAPPIITLNRFQHLDTQNLQSDDEVVPDTFATPSLNNNSHSHATISQSPLIPAPAIDPDPGIVSRPSQLIIPPILPENTPSINDNYGSAAFWSHTHPPVDLNIEATVSSQSRSADSWSDPPLSSPPKDTADSSPPYPNSFFVDPASGDFDDLIAQDIVSSSLPRSKSLDAPLPPKPPSPPLPPSKSRASTPKTSSRRSGRHNSGTSSSKGSK